IRRLGGERTVRVDVRIIAAAGIDLERAVAERRFRRDLYHRLLVLSCRLPPLRDRHGDIEFLAHQFLDRFAQRYQAPARTFSPAALARLQAYPWPGNIRELAHAVEAAVLACDGPTIGVAHLPPTVTSTPPPLTHAPMAHEPSAAYASPPPPPDGAGHPPPPLHPPRGGSRAAAAVPPPPRPVLVLRLGRGGTAPHRGGAPLLPRQQAARRRSARHGPQHTPAQAPPLRPRWPQARGTGRPLTTPCP